MAEWHRALVPALALVPVLAAAALAAAMTAQAQSDSRLPPAADLARAAGEYVDRYQREFAFLLADETYHQQRTTGGPAAPPLVERRLMRGELFLTWLDADRRWMAVHDFAEVDGVPVPGRGRADLRALLRLGGVRAVGERIAARNAQYNLGRVVRNFNEPTLALQMFDRDRRSGIRYSRGAASREGEMTLVTLAFRERDRPTLVSSVRGGPVFSTGEALIEAATGVIRRTAMRFDADGVKAAHETDFGYDAGVGLWVPVSFSERYELDADGHRETITAVAHYTNYRRFETSGRLAID